MITDFLVLSAESKDELTKLVHGYMERDWQPFGEVAVADMHDIGAHPYYAQALVKYGEATLAEKVELAEVDTMPWLRPHE